MKKYQLEIDMFIKLKHLYYMIYTYYTFTYHQIFLHLEGHKSLQTNIAPFTPLYTHTYSVEMNRIYYKDHVL